MKKNQTQLVIDKIRKLFERQGSISPDRLRKLIPKVSELVLQQGLKEAERLGIIRWSGWPECSYLKGRQSKIGEKNKIEVLFNDGIHRTHDTLDQVAGDVLDCHAAGIGVESIAEVTPEGKVIKYFGCTWSVTIEEI
jgi:hypothetical protein